jgi:proline iminopeptidase
MKGLLHVGDGHRMYWEEHGSPTGIPVAVCHGGPGGGMSRAVLRFFDLRKWRVILFDQRGCGLSRPRNSTEDNTTWHLVADMERLREDRGIERWALWGGSWGTTLALAYASKHGSHVLGMVLRGVCLMDPWEQAWLYGPTGAARLNPEAWSDFCRPVRRQTRGCRDHKRVIRAYGPLMRRRSAKARAWWKWEAAISQLEPKKDNATPAEAMTLSVLEHHYFSHNAWLRPGQLLAAAPTMNFPVYIVQGRYDLVCPPKAAASLVAALPRASIKYTMAGHSAMEPQTALELRRATGRLAKELSP